MIIAEGKEQTRTMSMVEAWTNGVLGFVVASLLAFFTAKAMFDIEMELWQASLWTAIFTIVSIIRSYTLRRFFNWIQNR